MNTSKNGYELKAGLIRVAKRIKVDSNYSARRHFNTGAYFTILHYVTGIGGAFLSAIAAYSIYFGAYVALSTGGITAIFSAILISIFTVIKPGEQSFHHYIAGRDYLVLYHDTLFCLDVSFNKLTNPELEEIVRKLRQRLDSFNANYGTLWTPKRAFLKAREDIRKGYTEYDSDDDKPH